MQPGTGQTEFRTLTPMPDQQPSNDLLARLRDALGSNQIDLWSVWLTYFSLGGNADAFDLDAYIHELITPPATDQALLQQACREILILPP